MKIVVYGALFGPYESLQEIALAAGAAADFLLFTDTSGLRSATWKVVYVGRLSADPARDARRVKILAHEYPAMNPDVTAARMDPRYTGRATVTGRAAAAGSSDITDHF